MLDKFRKLFNEFMTGGSKIKPMKFNYYSIQKMMLSNNFPKRKEIIFDILLGNLLKWMMFGIAAQIFIFPSFPMSGFWFSLIGFGITSCFGMKSAIKENETMLQLAQKELTKIHQTLKNNNITIVSKNMAFNSPLKVEKINDDGSKKTFYIEIDFNDDKTELVAYELHNKSNGINVAFDKDGMSISKDRRRDSKISSNDFDSSAIFFNTNNSDLNHSSHSNLSHNTMFTEIFSKEPLIKNNENIVEDSENIDKDKEVDTEVYEAIKQLSEMNKDSTIPLSNSTNVPQNFEIDDEDLINSELNNQEGQLCYEEK